MRPFIDSHKTMWVFLNGQFVKDDQALISVFDHGFLYGDGVFETLRAYGKRIFLLDRHLARLYRSCELVGLIPSIPEEKFSSFLAEVLHRNNLTDALLRITISRGVAPTGLDGLSGVSPTTVIFARPLPNYPKDFWRQGVRLVVVKVRRNLPLALPSQIKSLNYLNNILAKQEATEAEAFDGLMLNVHGCLAECTSSNIFFIKSEKLYTPAFECGIFPGLTREMVIQFARELGLSVEEGNYYPEQLTQADECFITNTGFEILPVRKVGDIKIGANQFGPITKKLQDRFHANIEQHLTLLKQEF